MSNSLWTFGLQNTRLLYPPLSPDRYCYLVAQSCLTSAMPRTAAHQDSLSFTISQFAQTQPWVSDDIQPSHPLPPPSPPAFNLSQHQGLFQWAGSSHQVARSSEVQFSHQFFQWILRVDFLYDWLVWSPCSPRDSPESSPVSQLESINYLAFSLLYGPNLSSVHDYWKNHSFGCMNLCLQNDVSAF